MDTNQSELNEKKERSKKPILVVSFLILFLLGYGIYYWQLNLIYIKTDDARISGSLVNISAKAGGKIKEIKVKEGDLVKAGQVIAILDNKALQDQVSQAQAALQEEQVMLNSLNNGSRPQEIQMAEASAQAMETNMKNAWKNYLRYQELFNQGAVSSQTLDGAKTAYEVARSQYQAAQAQVNLLHTGPRAEEIAAAQARVKKAQALLELNKENSGETIITSPVDGIVAVKQSNIGEVVGAGQSIVSIVNINDLWLNARIEETKISKLKIGQKANFTIDAYPGVKFHGKITEIGAATSSVFALFSTENASGNFTKVTQRIPIKISLPNNSSYQFRPGMSALIQVKVK